MEWLLSSRRLRRQWALAPLLALASGCGGGGGNSATQSAPWPTDYTTVFTTTQNDPSGDLLVGIAESPTYPVDYPPVDIKQIDLGVDGGNLYIRLLYAGVIPTAPQAFLDDPITGMEAQTVLRHNTNVVINADDNNATGRADMGVLGIDTMFSAAFDYGGGVRIYSFYGIVTHDEHLGEQKGELGAGGPGYDYAIVRFPVAPFGVYLPIGKTVSVGSWTEAESDRYPHFGIDSTTPSTWPIE